MPHDLVRWNTFPFEKATGGGVQDDDQEWDLPPRADPPARITAARRQRNAHAIQKADQDAEKAHQRDDEGFAVQREEDAAEHRQSLWDWGDLRTWMWIIGMCAGFLLFTALVYFLPYGRHNQNDGGNMGKATTPAIRVY